MRITSTGATRNNDETKNDYEGYLSPLFIEAFGDYMTSHRKQADGVLRASDNWQKGMPKEWYMKSLWRHVMDVWKIHRGYKVIDKLNGNEVTLLESLCACYFNIQGYAHEHLKEQTIEPEPKGLTEMMEDIELLEETQL